MSDVLPCPFCGGTPEVLDLCGWEILCRDCGASMCDSDDASREGAIAAWNRRTVPTGTEPHRHFWIRHSATHYTCRDCGEPMFPPSGPTVPAKDGRHEFKPDAHHPNYCIECGTPEDWSIHRPAVQPGASRDG